MYTTVWRFVVRPDAVPEFERHYGPEGTWASLFRKGSGYLGTELFRTVAARATVYVTIDSWESQEDWRRFREAHAADYATLDAQLEQWTFSEQHVGEASGPGGVGLLPSG